MRLGDAGLDQDIEAFQKVVGEGLGDSNCGAIVVPGACPSRGGGRHVPGTHTAVPILISKSGDTGETNKAAQRFRDRRLNDLRSAARPTRSTGTDASVTFRPLILTPAQRVSRS
jgi:hypothetical protein